MVGCVITFGRRFTSSPTPPPWGPRRPPAKIRVKKACFGQKCQLYRNPGGVASKFCLLSSLFANRGLLRTLSLKPSMGPSGSLGATRTSTSSRIRRLGHSILERGANSRSLIVDVNEDSPPWALNFHAWWKFREPERRRHRRFAILLAQ